MEISKSRSFFQDLKLREIDGYRVRKRPYMGNDLQDSDPIGALVVEHIGEPLPPMALSFCQRMMEYKSQSEIWCKQGSHV
ncbi:hypothetical protein ACS0TY_007726 [Phlomoides rotata]